MDTDSSSITIYEQFKRRQDSFQEAFQIYEPFELNSSNSSPILSGQASEGLNSDSLKSDSTVLSDKIIPVKCLESDNIGKINKKRGSVRPNHTPRPPNSFILYRRDKHAEILMKSDTERVFNNNTISRVVAEMWKKESADIKQLYAAKAEEEKQKHFLKYPDYKYQPRKNKKPSNNKPYKKSSFEAKITTSESTHPFNHHYPFSFGQPFPSPWAHQHYVYDFQSQFSLNNEPSSQTFCEYKSIDDYTLNQMEPNYQF